MKNKKLLLQIEHDETVKWLCGDEQLCALIAILARMGVASQTVGREPHVTVISEEQIGLQSNLPFA